MVLIISIRKAKELGTKIIDVDGSYLYRKQQSSGCDMTVPDIPGVPLMGWEPTNIGSKNVDNIPKVTHGRSPQLTQQD